MSKIYLVTVTAQAESAKHFVRANTRAAAVNKIAAESIKADIPTQDELIEFARAGGTIVDDKPSNFVDLTGELFPETAAAEHQ